MDTESLITKFLQHLAQRNLRPLVDMFADVIDWYIPGDEKRANWLGRRSTKQQVMSFYKNLWHNTEAMSTEVDHIFIDGNTGVIIGEFTTRMLQTKKVVTSPFCIQIIIQDELIIKYRLLEDSYAVSVSLHGAE